MVPPTTLGAAQQLARGRIPASEARMLLCHLLGCGAAQISAYPERPLTEALAQNFVELLARRIAGEPMAYLLGVREFYGRDFAVGPAVLIPRPDTELIIELALELLGRDTRAPILDLGTGSGALAVTLALELPTSQVMAVDFSAAALDVARHNGERLGARVAWRESDWFTGVDATGFGLIVSNPPYIAEGDPHLSQGDLRFEPPTALASGPDGLDDLRRIIHAAPGFLADDGWLLLEHGYDQAGLVRDLLDQAGYRDIRSARDLASIERVTLGRRP